VTATHVERLQVCSVCVKGCVIKLSELFRDGVDVGHDAGKRVSREK
jgi:hypothetical protein